MFAVNFEVNTWPETWDDHLGHAAVLRRELVAVDGFIANERYSSLGGPGWLVSLTIWRDEKALIRWLTHALHHEIQGKSRSSVFADYHLRVGEIVADIEAPEPLPQNRFDATEVGASKALTVTPDSLALEREGEIFDSITRPGDGLYLRAWRDVAAAEAGVSEMPGRHRVIRDYGMFARAEAPQYFPP